MRSVGKFVVEKVALVRGGCRVIGRCGELAIGLCDVFTSTAGVAGKGPFDSDEFVAATNVREVSLRVDEISAYGRKLEQLSAGMTAELLLVGSGQPEPHDILRFEIDEVSAKRREGW